MKQESHKWVIRAAFLFLAVVILLFLAIAFRTGVRLVLVQKLQSKAPWIQTLFRDSPEFTLTPQEEEEQERNQFGEVKVKINWEAEYPFPENTELPLAQPEREEAAGIRSPLEKISEIADKIRHKIGQCFREMVPGYHSIVAAGAGLEDAIGWNIPQYSEYNPVMELEDNYFISVENIQNMEEAAASLKSFGKLCSHQNAGLLYVLPPSKVDPQADALVADQIDFSNRNRDMLIKALDEQGIACMDLRENMGGPDLHTLFFDTDHHWKPETGLWAASLIAENINEAYGWNLDTGLLAPEQYDRQVLEGWVLGSQGKKVTLARADPEDITLLYPRYETRLRFQVPSMDLDVTGDFSVTYNRKFLEEKDLVNGDPYAAYAYCNQGLVRFENQMPVPEKKILVIKDSFANVVTPFLAQTVSQLDVLDLRIFTGSVQAYMESYQPDLVIVLYSQMPGGEIQWDSHKDLFDFR